MSRRRTKLPKKIVPIQIGLDLFCQWKAAPCPLLAGLSPLGLFEGVGPFLDIDRVWFVGSCAWTPVVLGKPWDNETDIDICFYDRDQALAFRDHVVNRLTTASAAQVVEGVECNRFGGPKLFWQSPGAAAPDADEFMDIFWLPPSGRTIVEVISEFKQDHEKVAIVASAQPGDVNAVTRLTYPWKHNVYFSDGMEDEKRHRDECHACTVDKVEADRRSAYDYS